eukprot:TRINITY_DN268_c0_g1_i1.p1 TRINITY_DN268_c0_g1~~TRINITY_DN268_c0_g1_i1.p1  ORF type:complete len:122 (-),score=47.39 TRINITY_DN268_c0_g1_i1:68-433(-)
MAPKKGSKMVIKKFAIDYTVPLQDGLLQEGGAQFEQFLNEKIKVAGKTGNLGTKVEVKREKSKIFVSAEMPFSKRYLKYLTKKFLKKQGLRDFLHVVASSKNMYDLRYFNIPDADDAEDDE